MTAKEFSDYATTVLKGLVNNPDKLSLEIVESSKTYVLSIKLLDEDIKWIVGRHGRIKTSLQNIFWAASQGKAITLEFISLDKN